MKNRSKEYVVVGAGPAGICAVAKLYAAGIKGEEILWIDPQFKVGEFGTTLSAGSSVPGNTAVENYQKVNHAIYQSIPVCSPIDKKAFEMSALTPTFACTLKTATEPLQHISNKLCELVETKSAAVTSINETKDGLSLQVKLVDGQTSRFSTKRIILAVGAEPKTLHLPKPVKTIHPNVAFIQSELNQFLTVHPEIKSVAVIGSSHSAALATMHLLQAGIHVKQFMNKPYKFATPKIAPNGTKYMQFDNTGLKGSVATFTQELLSPTSVTHKNYKNNFECIMDEKSDAFQAKLAGCTHAVVCIGYKPLSSLRINGLDLAKFSYDKYSTQMLIDGRPVPGVFGIGAAFPLEVTAISGEVEFAVGVGKFWSCIDDKILKIWRENFALSNQLHSLKFFSPLNTFSSEPKSELNIRAKL